MGGWSPITPITPDTVGTRSACKELIDPQGSMPADVAAADAVATDDLATGLLNTFGSMDISSAVTLPVVAAASLLLIATSAVIVLKRNRVSSDAEQLLAPEE